MGQNWEKLLRGIITLQAETGSENWDRYFDNDRIYDVSGLERGEVEPAKEFLVKRGLICLEETGNGTRRVIVDSDGFKIAREQEFRESQRKSSKIIALFTIVLGASTALNLGVNVVSSSTKADVLISNGVIVVVTLISVLYITIQDDFFDEI